MELSPSEEAKSPSAKQVTSRILLNPQVVYRLCNKSLFALILCHMNLVSVIPYSLFTIHFNITLLAII